MAVAHPCPVVSPRQVWPALSAEHQHAAIALLVRLACQVAAAPPPFTHPEVPDARPTGAYQAAP
jgi:hypothetical protein